MSSKRAEKAAHKRALIERELVDLDEECARARRLLRRLAATPRSGRDRDGILGELAVSVLHLHVHTKGLDVLLDELE